MSLTRVVGIGTMLGTAAAVAVYVAATSGGPEATAAPFAPAPTPVVRATVHRSAPCPPGAVLRGAECVVTLPGPTVTSVVGGGGAPAPAAPAHPEARPTADPPHPAAAALRSRPATPSSTTTGTDASIHDGAGSSEHESGQGGDDGGDDPGTPATPATPGEGDTGR